MIFDKLIIGIIIIEKSQKKNNVHILNLNGPNMPTILLKKTVIKGRFQAPFLDSDF